jgi:hypothetical protein
VELTGDETEKVFDQVLTDLAREAPPVPGFRRQKGGISLISPCLSCSSCSLALRLFS